MNKPCQRKLKDEVLRAKVIGMQGQTLGIIDELVLDVTSGHISSIVLSTNWSQIQLAWDKVEFDPDEDAFRIRKRRTSPAIVEED